MPRRLHDHSDAWRSMLGLMAVPTLLTSASLAASACDNDGGSAEVTQLKNELDALAQRVEQAEEALAAQEAELAEKNAELTELKRLTAAMDVNEDGVRFVGVNVYVQNGEGLTNASPNGVGNLIVGYDEGVERAKSGSHNLILGWDNGYQGVGGIVSGTDNVVVNGGVVLAGGGSEAFDGSVSIGSADTLATAGVVVGGSDHRGASSGGVIIGGNNNNVSGDDAVILGGSSQTATVANEVVFP